MKNKAKVYADGELLNKNGEYLLCTIGNGQYVGGSFNCSPRAMLDDGMLEAVYEKYSDLAVIHFDAHTDLRTDYEGEPYSHATPIRKIADTIGPNNVYSFGIRSGLKEELQWAKENGMHISLFEVLEPLKQVLPTLKGRNVYVTIDIDVLDPAHAPGTGTVDAGGITPKELLASIHEIARSEVNVVGFDLVEVAPVYDHSEITVNTAAKLIREMILGWVK